jgi:hypothetical protein
MSQPFAGPNYIIAQHLTAGARRRLNLPGAEDVLVKIEIDAFAAKGHPFHPEAKALFGSRFEGELDLAACAYDALPR